MHDNERRWRVTRERTEQLVQAMTAHTADTKTADTGKASGAGEDPPVGDQESLS